MIGSLTQKIFLQMIKGDTLSLGFTVDGLTADLDEVYFSCRTEYGSPTYVFQASLTGGQVTKVATGQYLVTVPPSNTANVAPGDYVYDLEVTLGTNVFTPLIGTLKIDWGVSEGAMS